MELFSLAQCVGYVAFVLGIAAFLQKVDRRLKFLIASESLAYCAHFALLGNSSASASALISCVRSLMSLRTRARWLAWLIIGIYMVAGIAFARSGAGWLPVIGSAVATLAMFFMRGIPMRLVLLSSTLMWLANNIISRSIGGTMLESAIAIINISTMIRIFRSTGEWSSAFGEPEAVHDCAHSSVLLEHETPPR
ncbi:MAG: YgjV family protein [Candidatus Korobacteraceae bacterium]|jgi:hypothetical protein